MTHAVNATLFKGRSKLDLDKDLRPVALLAGTPVLGVVPADSKIQSLADLVAASRTRPVNAGASGIGKLNEIEDAGCGENRQKRDQHRDAAD